MESFNPKYRGEDYLDQYYRLERWYKKVLEVKNNKHQLNGTSIEEQEDCFYIFFLITINLRDWLKKAGDKDVNNLFYGNKAIESLQICTDFINNFKHFDNRRPNLDKDTYFISRSATARLGLSKEQLLESDPVHTWYISSQGKDLNAYSLVEECFLTMKNYMTQKQYI